MSKFIDLTGKKFNHLLVVERVENAPGGVVRWKCLCDCGKYTVVRSSNLKNGAVKTCGCSWLTPHNKSHNMSHSRIYMIWAEMRRRCQSPKDRSYANYGGRGICVCDEWSCSFQQFYDWAVANGYTDALTIDRIDVNGDYTPENCRWIPKSEQSANRRSCLMIKYKGRTQNLKQWCDELGLNYKRTHNRITHLGMSFEDAISRPVMEQRRNKEARKKYG